MIKDYEYKFVEMIVFNESIQEFVKDLRILELGDVEPLHTDVRLSGVRWNLYGMSFDISLFSLNDKTPFTILDATPYWSDRATSREEKLKSNYLSEGFPILPLCLTVSREYNETKLSDEEEKKKMQSLYIMRKVLTEYLGGWVPLGDDKTFSVNQRYSKFYMPNVFDDEDEYLKQVLDKFIRSLLGG